MESNRLGDTKYLLSASMDSSCNIWEVNTGKCVKTIKFNAPVRSIAVSEGDQYLCLATQCFAGAGVRFRMQKWQLSLV